MDLSSRFLVGASVLALGVAISAAPQMASAQTAPAETDDKTPTVVVTDKTASAAYRIGEGQDSGVTTIDTKSIEARAPGTGDVLQILKLTPGVQFTINEGEATRDSLRDLRPSEISISGGRPTENLFILDGVSVNSQMEMHDPTLTGPSPQHYDAVAGATPQSVWVDSDLVGTLTLRDSNVSAEFGRFTGGVVEITTRDPSRKFGMSGNYSYSGDDLARYHKSPAFTSSNVPAQPAFKRERWTISADLPVNDKVSVLTSYSRSEAETYSNWSANLGDIGGSTFGQTSLSENYLLKVLVQPRDNLRLSAQVTHAPYRTDYQSTSGINNLVESQGGGTTARLNAAGSWNTADWTLDLTYAFSDNDREAENIRYDRRAGVEVWCVSGICTDGWIGAINQRQEDLTLNGTWRQPFHGGDLGLGFTITDISAQKERMEDGEVYSISNRTTNGLSTLAQAVSNLTDCVSPTDPTCVQGFYAHNNKVVYPAYDARVDLQSYSLWGEYTRELAGFEMRAGLRYDYETFLAGHTLSPRFSVTRKLPFDITATAGLNRYYGRSYLGYAIREKISNTLTYRRGFTTTGGGRRLWAPDSWVLVDSTVPVRYRSEDLDSPYNDEATLSFSGPLFGGQWRLRGVHREGKDLFSRSIVGTTTVVDELGNTRTVNQYKMTNGGESSYDSGSIEYTLPWRNHSFTFSTAWSDTKQSAVDYYNSSDDDSFSTTMVLYNGQVMSLLDLLAENQRADFATPFMANVDWQSQWFDDRLSVTVGGRFRDRFERIESTTNYQVVDGVRYQIYEVASYHSSFDIDANFTYALMRGDYNVTLEARVSNLLDKLPNRDATYQSQPWQMGRNAWLGIRVKF